MEEMLDTKMCSKCRAFHSEDALGKWVASQCVTFDPEQACLACGKPVFALSLAGPLICPPCDAGIKAT